MPRIIRLIDMGDGLYQRKVITEVTRGDFCGKLRVAGTKKRRAKVIGEYRTWFLDHIK